MKSLDSNPGEEGKVDDVYELFDYGKVLKQLVSEVRIKVFICIFTADETLIVTIDNTACNLDYILSRKHQTTEQKRSTAIPRSVFAISAWDRLDVSK